ncbi:hypothetical protein PC116_g4183 [Phytophthora cactorum]|uniref:Uncharacterized protein n=1 Tax=Phytophthora cactorum TaxID=29920 RepID=A0A8T1FWD9_9STRA|nr:hypothetical protein Pcac1_g24857 [Phytophthora cactorum]KAG2824287.1 hypothetical protein PC111_g9897 [Phytophthora cactorum]KAG2979717.1 hypothetical protein PC118_g11588 [Phytophthora cactorum]KAG3065563.1 hypothetical protein PC121_g11305 [Phytophthora cactorum]KAG3199185.1 hypothetical protein PC128_g5469 [Phytophthora cactorum]
MPSTKPVKSAISSVTEFKTLCVTVSKSYKIRLVMKPSVTCALP